MISGITYISSTPSCSVLLLTRRFGRQHKMNIGYVSVLIFLLFEGTVAESVVLTGPYSALMDDAPSSVTCPSNMKAYICKCYDDCCDGARISPDGRTCTAFHGIRCLLTRAVARCVQIEPDNVYRVVSSGLQQNERTSAECPDGLKPQECTSNLPWKHMYQETRLASTMGVRKSESECYISSDVCSDSGCEVQAVCLKYAPRI
ncbi:uncharacterized protein LOC141907268 [Tubulanus polymorphus]|uniref:uncharacterized protein LOC141907268 n=1 Tax=Tubulanus polymorphus TaxID=672921 RepID=UPI003DA48248